MRFKCTDRRHGRSGVQRRPRAENSEEELHGNSPIAAARLRERALCQAILICAGDAANHETAKALAFDTRVPRQEAMALLAKLLAGSGARVAPLVPPAGAPLAKNGYQPQKRGLIRNSNFGAHAQRQ